MFGVKDWYGPSKAQLGRKRPLTYEVSSFGNLKIVDNAQAVEGVPLQLEKVLVSQSGSVTGPVFCCNCVSIVDGPFTATLTWQKGSIEEKMIDELTEYLNSRFLTGFDHIVSWP